MSRPQMARLQMAFLKFPFANSHPQMSHPQVLVLNCRHANFSMKTYKFLGRYAVQSIVRQRDRKFFRNLLGIKVTRKDSSYLNHEDAEIYEYKRSDGWTFICDFSLSNTWHDVKIMSANAE
jgi:hypothetical protein